jgi:tetratricopeptide (TPR) repeat protein
MLNDMVKMATSMTEGGSFTKIMENFEKKFRQNAPPQSASSPKKPVRVPKKGPEKMTAAKDAGWDRKALALWQDGKYADAQKALEYWSRFIGSNPQSAEAYNNRALAYCDLKRFPQAVEDYSQALRIKTDYAAAYNNRGNVYYELNRYELAEADFNRSIQLKPDYSRAYLNRGLMYYQLGKNDQACLDFKKSCDLGDCEGKQWGISKGICN